MKKLVAIFTLSFFLLSVIPSFAYDEENVNQGEIYFEKNFDDAFFGSADPFDDMTVRPSGNRIETAVETNGNRYMLFEKYSPDYGYNTGDGNSNFEIISSHTTEEEKIVLQFDVMPKETATKMLVMLTDNKNKTYSYSFELNGKKLCGVENKLVTNEWTTIRAFYDFSNDKPYITVYANDTQIYNGEINNVENFWRVRFHSEKRFSAGTYCFDNFVIYSGDPIFDNSIYELNYKSVVKADNNKVEGVSAISIYGDYIIDGIKGRDAEIIKCENDRILISCEKLATIYNTQIDTGEYLLYDEALAKLGKIPMYDDRGFIYWSEDGENSGLSDDDKWTIHNDLMYERPSSSYLTESVKKAHPRLSISEGRIDEIRNEIKVNEYAKWYFETAKTRIPEYYSAKLLNDPSNTNNVMMKARSLSTRVKNLALWYYLMEDSAAPDAEEYEIKENIKNKIWENIEAVINDDDFPHWQPDSGLDNAEMAATVAYAYDWLYNEWNDEQKKAMEEALYKKALVYAEKHYGGQIGGSRSWWMDAQDTNQNAVINGGYILCAISIIDKYPETAGYVLEKAIRSLESFQNSFYPDGAWLEGTTYWTYSIQYWVPAVMSLEIAYGRDFGLTRAPGLEKSPEYMMYASSINENNNYHDSELNLPVYSIGSFYGLADLYNKPSWADWKLTYDWYYKISHGMTTLINFPASSAKVLDDINLPKDGVIKRDAVGSFREDWLDASGMYLSYHGGHAYPNHGNCDTGTFVYEYDGVRFAVDLPTENYSFTGDNRLNAYRIRPEGHNCLVINPDATPGHNTTAFSPIEKFETNEYGGYGILNMTKAYENYASSVRRGFKTDDNRNSMIIRDEIEGITAGGEVYWFMHTDATTDITIKEKTAILTNSGKSIKVEFLTNAQNFEVKVMNAAPLSTSPNPYGQSSNAAYKKLAFRADCAAGDDIYIQAKLSPVAEDIVSAENTPLEQWTNDTLAEISVCDGGEIRAEIGSKDLFSFIALYKGDELYSFLPAENNSYDGMTVKSKLSSEEDISAKLFVWKDRKTLVPLMETLPINIEKN